MLCLIISPGIDPTGAAPQPYNLEAAESRPLLTPLAQLFVSPSERKLHLLVSDCVRPVPPLISLHSDIMRLAHQEDFLEPKIHKMFQLARHHFLDKQADNQEEIDLPRWWTLAGQAWNNRL